MKQRLIIFITILVPSVGLLAQSATETSINYNKITTGLSIALIIMLLFLTASLIQKGRLRKENNLLQKRIKELERRNR